MNIYIGNLDFKVDEVEIIKMFALYGDVETVKLIRDKDTGRSKGFGFVEMPKEEDARRAIDNLNESEVMGRPIKVNSADENKSDDDRDRRKSFGGGDQRRGSFNRDKPYDRRPDNRSSNRNGGYERRGNDRPSYDRPQGRFDRPDYRRNDDRPTYERRNEDRPAYERRSDDRRPYDRRPDDRRPDDRRDHYRKPDDRPTYDKRPDDRYPRNDRPRTNRPYNNDRNFNRPPADRNKWDKERDDD